MSRLILTEVGGDPMSAIVLDRDDHLVLGPGEVLIEVEAAPINPTDLAFAGGSFGVYPQVPAAMGAEGVGRVLEAGEGADTALVGQRVLMLPTFVQGTWAERVVMPDVNVVPLTVDADVLQLAMLAVNPAAARSLLRDYATLSRGDWVGLTLANSGVGQNLIALAARSGIRTLAVVRREEAAKQVRALGADAVVFDGPDLGDSAAAALGGEQMRVLFDGTGGPERVGALAPLVSPGGTVVAYSSLTGASPVLPLADLLYRQVSERAFYILNWIWNTPRDEVETAYGELAELVAQAVIGASVEATYPLSSYREALAHAARGERSGKVLFTPGRVP